ncbi:unnamed protein product [Onchocerca flexuosa]|uniref:Methyltransferase domain-containing protein n=1 Tax=Onchocerca flexuosa TaxID=387005 RepID=A0A183HGQ8_9BILA|nr:unnamed protein product [Onchocerca flexuosa]
MADESSMNVAEDEIICSKLADKEYWIEHYERELRNFEEFGDEGEIWFGRVAENRLVNYVSGSEELSKSSKLIDFGCGNGSLLRTLVCVALSQLQLHLGYVVILDFREMK